jgi:hypothetical protein
MFPAFHARARLTPLDREAWNQKLLEGSFSTRDLSEHIQAQIEVAREGQRTSQALKQTIVCLYVFAPLLAILALLLGSTWLALPATLIVAAIALQLIRRYVRRFEISGQVSATAYPFITVLKHDVSASEPVRVRLVLSKILDPSKRTEVLGPYKFKAYHKIVDTTYADTWFEGEARLTDGSRLRWSVTDELKVSVRKKHNRRGKTKRKTRYYKRSRIEVRVTLPVKRYRMREVMELPGQTVSVRRDERHWTVNVSRAIKYKSVAPLKPRQLLDAIAVAFRAARPVSEVA